MSAVERPNGRPGLAAVLRRTWEGSREHAILQWGAALAFYASVSLGPLVLIVLSVVGPVVGSTALQSEIERHSLRLLGPAGFELVQHVNEGLEEEGSGLPKGLALIALLGGATLFFVQLQTALNHIWNAAPRQRHVWRFLRRRVKAILLTGVLGALLTASMVASTWLGAVGRLLELDSRASLRTLALLSWLGSIVFFALLLGVLYKTLPDVRVGWRDLAVGVGATTALFTIGRWLSGIYVARSLVVSSLYGAAGSLIVLLFWLYFSAVSVLLGAELTAAWAEGRGRPLRPSVRRRG